MEARPVGGGGNRRERCSVGADVAKDGLRQNRQQAEHGGGARLVVQPTGGGGAPARPLRRQIGSEGGQGGGGVGGGARRAEGEVEPVPQHPQVQGVLGQLAEGAV